MKEKLFRIHTNSCKSNQISLWMCISILCYFTMGCSNFTEDLSNTTAELPMKKSHLSKEISKEEAIEIATKVLNISSLQYILQ